MLDRRTAIQGLGALAAALAAPSLATAAPLSARKATLPAQGACDRVTGVNTPLVGARRDAFLG